MKVTITWILTDNKEVFKDLELDNIESIPVEAFLLAPIDIDYVKNIKIDIEMEN